MSAATVLKSALSFGSSVSRAETKVSSLQKSCDETLGSKVAVETELAEFDAGLATSDEAPATLAAKRRELARRLSDAASDATLTAQLLESAKKTLVDAKRAADEAELAGQTKTMQDDGQRTTKQAAAKVRELCEIAAPAFRSEAAAIDLAHALKVNVPFNTGLNLADVVGEWNASVRETGGKFWSVNLGELLVPDVK